ncbi:MAG: 50S ribosomal protein L24 [Piscirickettsiaceae bacterium CG_4_9_14_3_um_filter_43_564]|nr:50S ribosomal protein L24 [Thiomicrospira sp.]OIP96199.1 MAG: 50S ribosomal protein L24 [Thiomicrospira sp. CG2_30_44_34]PIQ06120.1 MAG: 50S ribosomal protein L24 [Piscirickettsiaceae bacterium CG18_big_fil_WC_8_21_14_2_50_44_103]PIU38347.1 MAG: 50S ribosomal protein L24 [Piscirickettsiaceae bacterium CG07_land_8_20_14_0_80_44_28]PIW58227.1 MAG: 50S ribosomal protein L24 [Piscirickettsiaceae bacterium CG12_big_fil_rev_8_21_14_0_65_44_934]PIW76740.1 MAG: 50S ribosomal protein L24 [Pisciricke
MNRLRKGDEVIVIAGKDKGKLGSVSQVMQNGKLLVDGVNLVKKHVKPNPMSGDQGGIVSKEMPIDASNVALYNPETKKADRVGIREENGVNVRYFKSNGKAVMA